MKTLTATISTETKIRITHNEKKVLDSVELKFVQD
jgi:hypothetical protein